MSVVAALCALYWFIMMRRNFRRDLVLLLIIGDFWKSFWFLVGTAVELTRGHTHSTQNSFCQASGYFLQVGLESCDLAIFLMSLHMSLQIFPPTHSFLGHDGLYRIRYWILAAWFLIPNLIVSLAFINSASAFISQGGFCTLPIRPFWYRLALSWIPRYLVWFFVMGVAVRIYRHVGYEFKVFGIEDHHSSTSGIGITHSQRTQQTSHTGRFAAAMRWSPSKSSHGGDAEKQAPPRNNEDIAPDDEDVAIPALPPKPSTAGSATPLTFDPRRRQSAPTWPSLFGGGSVLGRGETLAGQDARPVSKSNPGSRRGSKQMMAGGAAVDTEDFAAPLPLPIPGQRLGSSVSTAASIKSAAPSDTGLGPLSPITEQQRTSSAVKRGPIFMQEDNAATRAIAQRRRAIQRQLRLLFIYPVVYLIMWVMPFVGHALNYSNHFAQHPLFPISLLAFAAQSIMGTVDVCVFCWREKPWTHVPGADGTFWGSFKVWKFADSWDHHRRSSAHPASFSHRQRMRNEDSTSATGFLTSIKRWSTSKSSSQEPEEDGLRPLSTPPLPPPPPPPPPVKRIQHLRINSGRSDRRVMEAERAQERLALERAESAKRQYKSWQGRGQDHRGDASDQQPSSSSSSQPPPPQPSKEWWDRHMSIGDIDDLITQNQQQNQNQNQQQQQNQQQEQQQQQQ